METALILAGAAAKGAFEAGVLHVLTHRGLRFRRIVSASAGSLNAVVLAAGIRVGREREVAESLVELWTNDATWRRVFDLSLAGVLRLRGVSTARKVMDLLDEQLARWLDPPGERHDIELRMAVTLFNGSPSTVGPLPATTFEHILSFRGEQLDDPAQRAKLISAAVASAAFPVAFLPVDLGDSLGPALDGGAVDNTPIKEAIAGTAIRRVFVVEPQPAVMPPAESLSGGGLFSRLADIVIHERLFRDLREAYQCNDALNALEDLVLEEEISRAQLKRIKEALHWQDRRPLEIIPVRPADPLQGNVFSGFFQPELREAYIRAGRLAAETALKEYGVLEHPVQRHAS